MVWPWENALVFQTAFLRLGKEKPTLRSLIPCSPRYNESMYIIQSQILESPPGLHSFEPREGGSFCLFYFGFFVCLFVCLFFKDRVSL